MRLKVGLLICGEMPSALHRKGLSYPNLIKEWLGGHLAATTTYRPFRVFAGKLPASIHTCDCYFVSGSRSSLTEGKQWMRDLCDFLLIAAKAQVPVVGLCFGHQALATALGGSVGPAKNGWHAGVRTWKVIREEGWMRDCGKRLVLPALHRDQVQKLPPRSVRVATSDTCPNGVFRIANHTVGIQGHPEIPIEVMRQLYEMRAADLGAELSAQAIASLDEPTQSGDMARWCAGFVATRAV